jgi:hypothetical protein
VMLGHHPALRLELAKNGRRALAKVREAKRTHWAETSGSMPAQEVANQKVLWKLVLLVEPDGEEPFEAKVDELLGYTWKVEPSERHYQFVVLYDPSDHGKVVIDHSDEGSRMLDEVQAKERVDKQVDRMRGRGQDYWADRYQATEDSLAEFRRNLDPKLSADEREDLWEQQRQKMKETMAGDMPQRVEQIQERQAQLVAISRDSSLSPQEKQDKMTALAAEIRALVPGSGGRPAPVASAASSGPTDPLDTLAKLADLHDRGVLTDEEFQAQKEKLLAG